MKRAHWVLLASLLCSCTGPTGGNESDEVAKSWHLRFMERSDPLVDHTFAIMEVRAEHSETREFHRARGVRVCEEGEHGTTWKEDCNTCRCEWGIRHCPNLPCKSPHSPEFAAKLRAELQEHNRRKAVRDRALQELERARGLRVCEEGEHGTRWREATGECWCDSGIRRCTAGGWNEPPPHWPGPPPRTEPSDEELTFEPPPPDYRKTHESHGRRFCTEEQKAASWRWGCNACWCEGGFPVCSKAGCPAAP